MVQNHPNLSGKITKKTHQGKPNQQNFSKYPDFAGKPNQIPKVFPQNQPAKTSRKIPQSFQTRLWKSVLHREIPKALWPKRCQKKP